MAEPFVVRDRILATVRTDWREVLLDAAERHGRVIDETLTTDYEKFHEQVGIFPPRELVFAAFVKFGLDDLRVVILGLDPYIKEGQAQGLAFSVPEGTKIPPSLRNVFRELEREYGETRSTDLSGWAAQGVLLMNTSLTVVEGKTGSHLKAWKPFTDAVLASIAARRNHVVYMLWGEAAKSCRPLIDADNNLVLESCHPSPLAATRGKSFVGNGHFSACNAYLQ